MAEAGPGTNSGTQSQTNPEQARTFLASFGHQPDSLKGMKDPDVLKLHETVSGAVKQHGVAMVPFGEKWREAIAGEDTQAIETLKRFTDPGALYKSYDEPRGKMAKGELKAVLPFPAKGTAEEQTNWRKTNGIPESPDKYDIKLDGNLVIGDDDKPLVESFLKSAHAANYTPEAAKHALQWYFGTYLPETEKGTHERDQQTRADMQASLASKWGPDYKRNLDAVKAFVTRAPESLRKRILGGRLADGRPIGDDQEMLEWFATMELELNPHFTMTGPGAADSAASIDEKIKELENLMRTDRPAYNKRAKEYEGLIEVRNKINARGGK